MRTQHYLSLLSLIISTTMLVSAYCQEDSEASILLQIKSDWGNPPALASWNHSSGDHCTWLGINCTGGVVTSVRLINQNLTLPISDSICLLKNLSYLDLSNNELPGAFPQFLYNCSSLQHMNIAQNFFVGTLPTDIDKLPSSLTYFDVSGNNFTGEIPISIGRLANLKEPHLDGNLFNGTYPVEIANLVNLEYFSLTWNPFLKPARIPDEFGNLTKLKCLWMTQTNTIGEIPIALSKLAELERLDLGWNQITGTIPSWIWSLEKLNILYLYSNDLTGEIITGTIRCINLFEIDVSLNKLTGSIPESFSNLKHLSVLFLYYNLFTGEIPSSLGLLPNLTDIRLFNNNLTGQLPETLGKYSKLWNIEVNDNRLSGQLPAHLCSGYNLVSIVVFNNYFTGELPPSLANCNTLNDIQLYNNRFYGEFPSNFWSISNLNTIMIHKNEFTGTLPKRLPWNLTRLEIYNNRFTGEIPLVAERLQVFKASNNLLNGTLPSTFTNLIGLQELSVGANQISGHIPYEILDLRSLTTLNLSHNQLVSSIPPSIGVLPVLYILDLSGNYLSGSIPAELTYLMLVYLNLSFNQLTGNVPSAFYVESYAQSFLSNPGLCTSTKTVLDLPLCDGAPNSPNATNYAHDEDVLKQSKRLSELVIAFMVVGCAAFIGTAFIGVVIACKHRKWIKDSLDHESWKLTPFSALDFTELDILNELAEDNLIGRGGFGAVYKINLRNSAQGIIAVKKIWSGQRPEPKLEKQFQAEVQILGSMRHVNIVKLLCCIASTQTKLLVYEYMENSSLDRWLHERKRMDKWTPLDWPTRLQIAISAAQGLCHMHHDCSPPVVHRDVKSSNILLDPQFKAKIADFGLARVLLKAGEPETVSAIAGSYGYMAPECEYLRKINQKVDVYSFGVVLLELTTGRRANDGDDEHPFLADWAWHRFQERDRLIDAIDEHIRDPIFFDQVAQVFRLGLICTAKLPPSRPSMREVLRCLIRCEEKNPQGYVLRGEYEVARLLREKESGERDLEMVTIAGDDGDTVEFSVHIVPVSKH
ncbi:Leucine-rich receptor-like protein kinase family protein [Rhynchospora pubera]|uniref:Leucine-rich receptor-like protein kinase family protein n=1 Tax=Rhynchospora pubera TaxID=906938 RepID=A0AAV8EL33_9POAL|nr:Leucine-rich receptor-like protein kinase family protein [Rhynchospora pubera]